MVLYAVGAICCVLVALACFYFLTRKEPREMRTADPSLLNTPVQTDTVKTPQVVIQTEENDVDMGRETRNFKLTELSMDYMLLPNHVPGIETPIKLTPRRAGLPIFAAVSCDSPDDNTMAIRHDGKYLTVVTPSICRFESRRIGASCFTMVSGFCGQGDYIMFRHAVSGKFLRASMEGEDEDLYTLVCKDAPTTSNYRLFCWKLASAPRQNMYSDKFCGCKVDDSGVETCYPCDEDRVTQTESVVGPFPELIGFTVDGAKAVLRAKHPNVLTVDIACPSEQTNCRPVVYQNRQTVTLFFDPDTGRINRVPMVQ